MAYDLGDLPIHRSSKPLGVVVFLAFCWLLCLGIGFGAPLALRVSPKQWVTNPLSWFMMALAIYLPWSIWSASRRRAELCIDQTGVTVNIGVRRSEYRWADIQSVRKVMIGGRNQTEVVQIHRNGELFDDKSTNVIWGEFGIGIDDLYALIKAGAAKWGSLNKS